MGYPNTGLSLKQRLVGYAGYLWWGVVRSEVAQRQRLQRAETAWSGKRLHPEDLDSFIADQRPGWRRARR